MKPVSISSTSTNGRRRAGFSLLEMLVGMGILSVLVLALFAMFNQTQKALLANVGQSDVMESGRSIMDLLGRDLSRARPSNVGSNIIYAPGTAQINMVIDPAANMVVLRTAAGPTNVNVRNAFLDQWRRDSLLHDVFYLSETEPGQWTGAGLFVAPEDPNAPDDGVGTLYRYEDRRPVNLRGARGAKMADLLYDRFFNNALYRQNPTNSSRLLDGVVFFRVTPFGPSGQALDRTSFSQTNLFPIPRDVLIGPDSTIGYPLNATLFRGQAFPTSIEVELGLLPAELLERYRVLSPDTRANFLIKNLPNILVFRQRIPMATPPALP
jgi:prepilin-type N-terminal cleavage/methylation domain-containing protein